MSERIVLFDTVVLSNFARVDAFRFLEKRYSNRGKITSHVWDELQSGLNSERPWITTILEAVERQAFERIELTSDEESRFRSLGDVLHAGEASCLAAAIHRGGTVATDDKDARYWCDSFRVPRTGTVGILAKLVRTGTLILPAADDLLARMIEAGYYSPVATISELFPEE